MTTNYAAHLQARRTPQSRPIKNKPQVKNNSGGFVYLADDFTRLERFLILGAEGGTYYAGERELTVASAECVLRCAQQDPLRTVNMIVEISDSGRAPKNDPAIFALALIAGQGSDEARSIALQQMPKVCRIGTHLFQFVQAVREFRGFGRSLKNAIAHWYTMKTPEQLAYQVVKYQSRNGLSHRDVLRMCHASSNSPVFRYAAGLDTRRRTVTRRCSRTGRPLPPVTYPACRQNTPEIIQGFEQIKAATTPKQAARLIRAYDLPRECVPTQFLKEAEVWEALLEKMPITALIRNLATMTRVGIIKPLSAELRTIMDRLTNQSDLTSSRVHPVALLAALLTYSQGHGERGTNSWTPVRSVIDALDAAFYLAFGNVPSTDKRWLIACDVSGSMDQGFVTGIQGLSPRVATGALALLTASVEPQHHIVAFTAGGYTTRPSMHRGYNSSITPIDISPECRLDHVCREMRGLQMGGTDCALPMIYAQEQDLEVDVFMILTDNETWAGNVHPCQALRDYRRHSGINAKLIVNAMTVNEFTIADPTDPGSLDVVGFDTATPQIMAQFASY